MASGFFWSVMVFTQPFLYKFVGFGWFDRGERGEFAGELMPSDGISSEDLGKVSNNFSGKLYGLSNFTGLNSLGRNLDMTNTSRYCTGENGDFLVLKIFNRDVEVETNLFVDE